MAWNHSTRTNGQTIDASHINAIGSDVQGWGGNVDANGYKLTDLGAPTNGGDACNKTYVDSVAGGAFSNQIDTSTGSTSTSVTLSQTPDVTVHPVRGYKNGVYMIAGTDYTRTGTAVTLSYARLSTDVILFDYYY